MSKQQERVRIPIEKLAEKTARSQCVVVRMGNQMRRAFIPFSQIHEVRDNEIVVTPFIAKKEGLL